MAGISPCGPVGTWGVALPRLQSPWSVTPRHGRVGDMDGEETDSAGPTLRGQEGAVALRVCRWRSGSPFRFEEDVVFVVHIRGSPVSGREIELRNNTYTCSSRRQNIGEASLSWKRL